MIIYIPKYTDLYLKDGVLAGGSRLKGEYRAYLYDCNGSLKYDSGWKPNTLLDQAFAFMCTDPYGWALFRGGMALGDSDTPVNVTQTGLQGNSLGASNWAQDSSAQVSAVNGGAPNYEAINTRSYTFDAGNSTGTVKEFVFMARQFNDSPAGDLSLHATIRVVLDTPIVKGAADVLTIEHRLTTYPHLPDVTGTIDISGVAYNYIMRHLEIDQYTARVDNCRWHAWNHKAGVNDDLTVNTGAGPSLATGYGSMSNTPVPGGAPPYMQGNLYAGVDDWNVNIRTIRVNNEAMTQTFQVRLGKVSDDSPLEKFNTHTLSIPFRMYPGRYTP